MAMVPSLPRHIHQRITSRRERQSLAGALPRPTLQAGDVGCRLARLQPPPLAQDLSEECHQVPYAGYDCRFPQQREGLPQHALRPAAHARSHPREGPKVQSHRILKRADHETFTALAAAPRSGSLHGLRFGRRAAHRPESRRTRNPDTCSRARSGARHPLHAAR